MSALGPMLRRLRLAGGLTCDAVAVRLLVTGAAVSRWETGANEPSVATIATYARACGRDFDLARAFFDPATDRPVAFHRTPEALEAADLLDAATPEDRALLLTVLRRMTR